jgi:hypothetical protein
MMLTEQDKDDLHEAAARINRVMDRHTQDITLGMMSVLCQAIQDLRITERMMEQS